MATDPAAAGGDGEEARMNGTADGVAGDQGMGAAGGAAAGLSGYVTFELGGQAYATPLAAVREIIRLRGLTELPGMRPPLAGVLDLRGQPLPVLDIRPGDRRGGDVLVLEPVDDAEPVGVAVDAVRSVLTPDAMVPVGGSGLLPPYVVQVVQAEQGQVFVVDVRAMFAAAVPA